jgi:translation elongation factor EF-G
MANASHHSHLAHHFTQEASLQSNINAKKPGVLWRIFDVIVESRQKSANRKIALLLARSGGRITDSIEREITQSLLKGDESFATERD